MNLIARVSERIKYIDWYFLLFLVGITNVKLQVKLIVVIAYALFLLWKRAIVFRHIFQGAAKFYLLIPIVGLVAALINHSFHVKGYWFGFSMSVIIWSMCATAFILIKSTLNYLNVETQRSTIKMFFVLNALISLYQILKMVIVSKHLFPYWYNDPMGIYGISSGDHLQGIFFDTSTANATVAVMGIFYFLFLRELKYAYLCIVVCLLCTSNLTVLLLLGFMVILFLLFRKYRRSVFVAGVVTLGLYFFISPENVMYTQKMLAKVLISHNTEPQQALTGIKDSVKKIEIAQSEKTITNAAEANNPSQSHNSSEKTVANPVTQHANAASEQKVPAVVLVTPAADNFRKEPEIQSKSKYVSKYSVKASSFSEDSILNTFSSPVLASLGNAELDFRKRETVDTHGLQKVMDNAYVVPYDATPLALNHQFGKVFSFKQTLGFWFEGIPNLLFGAGPGNFSSKLAIKMTGFKLQGTYPERYRYISKTYFENHFYVYMYFLAKPISERSIINNPASVYNQLGGEYGLIGICLFAIFYVCYFIKLAIKDKRKMMFLLGLLLLCFFDYWFELFTLTIFFELFMLSDLSEKNNNYQAASKTSYSDVVVLKESNV